MTGAAHLLAVWLTPALWLAMPDFILDEGPGGLWIGLALTLIPLIALGVGRSAGEAQRAHAGFSTAVLLLVGAVLTWANLVLAGDMAARLEVPRWQGIAVAAAAAWLLTMWRAAGRIVPALLLAGALALCVPFADLVLEVGAGPLAAWARFASQTAFRFPAGSAWVTTGRDLGLAGGRAPLVFDEEHRVTAPSGGVLRARALDGARVSEREWTLSPGQSVTFRAGDRLLGPVSLPLRFEAGKRVPGAPASGMAWAAGEAVDWRRAVGLHVTLLVGGVALLATGAVPSVSRRAALLLGAALLATLLWAQGWAIYGVLGAPDAFLGGVTAERLAHLRAAPPWRWALGVLVLAAGLASFVASSIALRERVAALGAGRRGLIAYRPALWAGLFAAAGVASLWHADPWRLITLALGTAAAALGPAAMWPPGHSRAATAAGVVGLALFAAVAVVAGLRGLDPDLARVSRPAWLATAWGAALDYPALAAAPAGAAVLWVLRRAPRR